MVAVLNLRKESKNQILCQGTTARACPRCWSTYNQCPCDKQKREDEASGTFSKPAGLKDENSRPKCADDEGLNISRGCTKLPTMSNPASQAEIDNFLNDLFDTIS